ncbi:MAG TPA: SH3 domain-containing protein [Rhizomicrobium sp.]|jgi:hypothetical protein
MSLIAMLLAAAVAAAPVDTASDAVCSIRGYNADKDMTGTNIRSAPDAKAPVIFRLKPEIEPEDNYGAEFDVIGSKNGWLLIRNAESGQYGEGNGKIVFKGPGWISGALVGFTINDSNMRAAPSGKAKVVAQLEGDNGAGGVWGPDSFGVTRVYGCSGAFADVIGVTPTKKTYRGWVTKLCGNQRTTCP